MLAACGYEATGACVHQGALAVGQTAGAQEQAAAGAKQTNGVRWGQLARKGSQEQVLEPPAQSGPSTGGCSSAHAEVGAANVEGSRNARTGPGSGAAVTLGAQQPAPRVNPPFSLLPANYAFYTQPAIYQAAAAQVPRVCLLLSLKVSNRIRTNRSRVVCPVYYTPVF